MYTIDKPDNRFFQASSKITQECELSIEEINQTRSSAKINQQQLRLKKVLTSLDSPNRALRSECPKMTQGTCRFTSISALKQEN